MCCLVVLNYSSIFIFKDGYIGLNIYIKHLVSLFRNLVCAAKRRLSFVVQLILYRVCLQVDT